MITARDLQEILGPITRRLGALESQERIHSDAYEVDADFNWTLPGDLTVLGTIAGTTTAASLSPGANINGVLFTGLADITVPAAAGTLTGATLAANVLASSLTSVGLLNTLQVAGFITVTTVGVVSGTPESMTIGVAASDDNLLSGALEGETVLQFDTNLVMGRAGSDQRYMKLYGAGDAVNGSSVEGDLVLSRSPLGYDDHNNVDFWWQAGNKKLRIRAINAGELDNRVQFIGSRAAGDGSGDGYTVGNTTIGAGDACVSLIGAGAVAGMASGGTRPDVGTCSEITFWPDPEHLPWSATNTPGIITFATVRPGQAGFGGNYTCNHFGVMDSSGLWTLGVDTTNWNTIPDHSVLLARLNLRGDPGNSSFSALRMLHASNPTAGQLGQGIDWSFLLRGNSGAGNTWIEAGRIDLTKLEDFTSLANQSSQMRFRIIMNGTLEPRLTLHRDNVEMGAKVIAVAAAAERASINMPHGTAPSAPVDGDMWTDTAGMYVRINGVTKTVTLT